MDGVIENNKKGFTLIELLVVVAIIGILAAVGVVAYSGYTKGAKESATKAQHNQVAKYVLAELTKCNFETSVMNGNLTCSGRTYQDVVDAIIKTFSDLKHVHEPGKTVVTDGGSYSNNSGSTGYIRLQSPYNPKTHILIGTCYGDPCLLNKVEKYLETKIQITD
tara:strand:+ start:56 stop:547 length:492 start_codon:yes stop_codon:yes gene_type:complete